MTKVQGSVSSFVDRNSLFAIDSCLSFQLDYTEAGTCKGCFDMRKNASKAAEPCECRLDFEIKKAFKVIFLNEQQILTFGSTQVASSTQKKRVRTVVKMILSNVSHDIFMPPAGRQAESQQAHVSCHFRETSSSTTASRISIRTSADTWTPEMMGRWLEGRIN